MACLGTAYPAAAAPNTPWVLHWQAPAGCPAAQEVEAEIAAALAHFHGRGAVEVSAAVAAREETPKFLLRVRVQHAGSVGERVLPIHDCADTSRAAALLVALAVESPPPLTPPAPVRREAKRAAPPPARSQEPWSIGLGPRLGLGITPPLGAGVGASATYGRSFWRLSLRGTAFAEVNHSIPGSELGGSFRWLTVGMFACAGYPGDPLIILGCLGGRWDHLRARGFGTGDDAAASTQIGSPAAGITLEWSLTRRFRLRTELEAGHPLGDARFVIRNVEQAVHEVGALRGEAGLELAVAF